jgi:hypothetical protein
MHMPSPISKHTFDAQSEGAAQGAPIAAPGWASSTHRPPASHEPTLHAALEEAAPHEGTHPAASRGPELHIESSRHREAASTQPGTQSDEPSAMMAMQLSPGGQSDPAVHGIEQIPRGKGVVKHVPPAVQSALLVHSP